MRREVLFTLVGFLCGILISLAVFLRTGESSADVAGKISPGITFAATPGPRSASRLVVAGSELRCIVPGDREPGDLAADFSRTLGNLPKLDMVARQAEVNALLARLRYEGRDGLRIIREYLRSGSDEKFRDEPHWEKGQMLLVSSLRVALIHALRAWPDREAVGILQESLRNPQSALEAQLIVQGLNASAPGAYRSEILDGLHTYASREGSLQGVDLLLQSISHFGATERLPAAEELMANHGTFNFEQYVEIVNRMDQTSRAAALTRAFSNPQFFERVIPTAGFALRALDYSVPIVSQRVAEWFSSDRGRSHAEGFLLVFPTVESCQSPTLFGAGGVSVGPWWGSWSRELMTEQARHKLAFLDRIAGSCDTAPLQLALQNAREGLRDRIAKFSSPTWDSSVPLQPHSAGRMYEPRAGN